jgi:hypothetical protein
MPWIMQMAGFALLLLGMGIALWVSFWLLLFLFAVGVAAVVWTHLRDYLLAKGILNPRPGVPPEEPSSTSKPTTTIEGDFKRVDSE